MKAIATIITAIFIIGLSAPQAQETKQYNLRDFDKIDISSAFEAEITQGATFRIEVAIPDGTEDRLTIEKEGDELEISYKGSKGKSGQHRIKIQMPELKELEISGATSVKLNEFQGEKLEVEISGASTLQGSVSYNSIEIEASGASSIKLDGTSNSAKFYLSGASSLGNNDFKVKGEMILDLSGASKATLTADGDMYLQLSGASVFSYSGVGNVLKQELSGASVIDKKGE